MSQCQLRSPAVSWALPAVTAAGRERPANGVTLRGDPWADRPRDSRGMLMIARKVSAAPSSDVADADTTSLEQLALAVLNAGRSVRPSLMPTIRQEAHHALEPLAS